MDRSHRVVNCTWIGGREAAHFSLIIFFFSMAFAVNMLEAHLLAAIEQ